MFHCRFIEFQPEETTYNRLKHQNDSGKAEHIGFQTRCGEERIEFFSKSFRLGSTEGIQMNEVMRMGAS
jgi:hypothetical protein